VIVQAIGGMPRLIADGEISLEADSVIETVPQGFSDTRHPRTAVGISEDGRKIWLIVVDGRRPDHSVGFSLQELAEFLLELGAYSAINLDGGGSSSITFMGQVLNKPSDGRVRPVTNSFHVIVHP
jgi:exopolysaccharide biosynthesis protein